jgi:hypothetical protein
MGINNNIAMTAEEEAYIEKMVNVFNTHWSKLHEQIEKSVKPKMYFSEATEQTFVNLVMPILRVAVKEWEDVAETLTVEHNGKVIYARKSLMIDKIKETWGAEKGLIGEQIKRYL